MTMAKEQYKVIYERDETGWWIATVPNLEGCATQGKSIKQARNRIREAIEVTLDVKLDSSVKFNEDIRLSPEIAKIVKEVMRKKANAVEAEEKAAEALLEAATSLETKGLSLRDSGELLGVSFQRVQQLLQPALPKNS